MKPYAKINNLGNPVERLLIKVLERATAIAKSPKDPACGKDALLLGQADGLYRPKQKEKIYLSQADQSFHNLIIGSTGSGKTKLLELLIRQRVRSFTGSGVCLLDPHGDLYHSVLSYISGFIENGSSPEMAEYISRKLVLIDPAEKKYVVGVNPLEAAGASPNLLVSELIEIFRKHWSHGDIGNRTAELLRNNFYVLQCNGLTLCETKALLTNASFRASLVDHLPPGEVKEYFLYRYNPLSERMQAVYSEPILNRISIFLSDPTIRAIVGQAKSTINFRQIMDQGKWLLINLSKGKLRGNASLLGAFFVTKFQMAAFSRIDVSEEKRVPFFLFVDELQNLSDDFEIILSESRKMRLFLTLSHQHIAQMNRLLFSSILANTNNQIYFRLSHQDAAVLSAEFGQREKPLIQRKLVNLKPREAYIKKKGEPARIMKTAYVPRPKTNPKAVAFLKELSMSNWGRLRQDVEKDIAKRTSAIYGQKASTPTDPYKGRFAPLGAYEEGFDS
jgi:hypothetical protein